MIIVTDTTPIISLLKTDKLELLQKLFEIAIIPNAVYDELVPNIIFHNEAKILLLNFLYKWVCLDLKYIFLL